MGPDKLLRLNLLFYKAYSVNQAFIYNKNTA